MIKMELGEFNSISFEFESQFNLFRNDILIKTEKLEIKY